MLIPTTLHSLPSMMCTRVISLRIAFPVPNSRISLRVRYWLSYSSPYSAFLPLFLVLYLMFVSPSRSPTCVCMPLRQVRSLISTAKPVRKVRQVRAVHAGSLLGFSRLFRGKSHTSVAKAITPERMPTLSGVFRPAFLLPNDILLLSARRACLCLVAKLNVDMVRSS